jgi:hypothetical protein
MKYVGATDSIYPSPLHVEGNELIGINLRAAGLLHLGADTTI